MSISAGDLLPLGTLPEAVIQHEQCRRLVPRQLQLLHRKSRFALLLDLLGDAAPARAMAPASNAQESARHPEPKTTRPSAT